jgi:hypothetical protein
MKTKKQKVLSISKGYRLKPETHRLIEKLQRKTIGTKDEVISRACSMLNEELLKSDKNKHINNS